MREKRGQGLSMNVVILAILALLVLFVLSYVFTDQILTTSRNLNECESKGGSCVSADQCSNEGGSQLGLECYDQKDGKLTLNKNKVCCKLECQSQGGTCQSTQNGVCSDASKTLYYTNCDNVGKTCCLP